MVDTDAVAIEMIGVYIESLERRRSRCMILPPIDHAVRIRGCAFRRMIAREPVEGHVSPMYVTPPVIDNPQFPVPARSCRC